MDSELCAVCGRPGALRLVGSVGYCRYKCLSVLYDSCASTLAAAEQQATLADQVQQVPDMSDVLNYTLNRHSDGMGNMLRERSRYTVKSKLLDRLHDEGSQNAAKLATAEQRIQALEGQLAYTARELSLANSKRVAHERDTAAVVAMKASHEQLTADLNRSQHQLAEVERRLKVIEGRYEEASVWREEHEPQLAELAALKGLLGGIENQFDHTEWSFERKGCHYVALHKGDVVRDMRAFECEWSDAALLRASMASAGSDDVAGDGWDIEAELRDGVVYAIGKYRDGSSRFSCLETKEVQICNWPRDRD